MEGARSHDSHTGSGEAGSDLVILDLEDAVTPASKERSRGGDSIEPHSTRR
jgi:citrate lyase beta subunit